MIESKISITRIILGAALFVILLHLFSFDIAPVCGRSMQPTLQPGQVILVNRLAYGLQVPLINTYLFFWQGVREGDIIAFDSPVDNRVVVKRCIAVAGMPILLENGIMYAGGRAYPLRQESIEYLSQYKRVPDMTVLAVGDNPDRSIDSRIYGFIPLKSIRGRIVGSKGRTAS